MRRPRDILRKTGNGEHRLAPRQRGQNSFTDKYCDSHTCDIRVAICREKIIVNGSKKEVLSSSKRAVVALQGFGEVPEYLDAAGRAVRYFRVRFWYVASVVKIGLGKKKHITQEKKATSHHR